MANTIIMPKLSPTMEEGQISRWLKKEGDAIEANEPIAEVDTDKATMEVTSLEAGTLLKIVIGDGANAKLGETIGVIGAKGEDFSALLNGASTNGASGKAEEGGTGRPGDEQTNESAKGSQEKAASTAAEKEETVAEQGAQKLKESVSEIGGRSYDAQRPEAVDESESKIQNSESTTRLIVSPIAARMASENDINLKSIKGSGPNGRIIKRDIESALAEVSSPRFQVSDQENESASQTISSFEQTPEVQGASRFREENTSKMRQVIAQRLAQSIGPVPTFYLTVEIEMDKAMEFRKQLNASVSEAEKVSVNDIIVKVAAMASLKHPFVNSSYQEKTIRFYEDADVGVAVAIDEGLITPVVRGANRKGIIEISKEIKEMAARAREKKLQPEEYTGATFSISNLGMFGIEQFTAIINPPEAAIFAIGSAAPKAVVRDGEIVVRNVMNVTMSCDHRVIDGATGAKFLQTFKQMLENPILMLM